MKISTNIFSFFLVLSFFLVRSSTVYAEQLITLFFKPPPVQSFDHVELESLINQPEKISATLLKNQPSPVAGIRATFEGYTSITDIHGQLRFFRQDTKNSIFILITEKIRPVIFHGVTPAYWVVSDPNNTLFLLAEKKADIWNITSQTIAKDLKIPSKTLIIYARPKDIIVPFGISQAFGDPHLILPDFFVKTNSRSPRSVLSFLNYNQYYKAIKKLYKESKQGLSSLIGE